MKRGELPANSSMPLGTAAGALSAPAQAQMGTAILTEIRDELRELNSHLRGTCQCQSIEDMPLLLCILELYIPSVRLFPLCRGTAKDRHTTASIASRSVHRVSTASFAFDLLILYDWLT